MFKVIPLDDLPGFTTITTDSHSLQIALKVAIDNGEEKVQLIQQQIDELTAHYVGWLDGRDGHGLTDELDGLLRQYRKEIKALAVLNTLYVEL